MKRMYPSPALIVAFFALVVALSGTAFAVAKSDGDTIIKKSSLSGDRLKKDTVKGKQIKESSLKVVPKAKTVVKPPLKPLALASNWVEHSSYREAGFRMDASGFVHLQGSVLRSTTPGDVIAVLPPGYRPGGSIDVTVSSYQDEIAGLLIAADGTVSLYSGNDDFISLEGVIFYADK